MTDDNGGEGCGTKRKIRDKFKVRIPHPAFNCPKVKKHHYRRWLLASIVVLPFAHWLTPEWEIVAVVVNGLAFYWEPVMEMEV